MESIKYTGENSESYFGQLRPEIFELIPKNSTNILDIGCGAGLLGKSVKERQNCTYKGIEYVSESGQIAKKYLDDVAIGDVNSINLNYATGEFDLLIFADVLEHLIDPQKTLGRLLPFLKKGGKVIISLPNVRHFIVTIPLLFKGEWEYQDSGILDITHFKFFTKKSMIKFITDSGLDIVSASPNIRYMKRYIQIFDLFTFKIFQDHMAQQWVFLAEKK